MPKRTMAGYLVVFQEREVSVLFVPFLKMLYVVNVASEGKRLGSRWTFYTPSADRAAFEAVNALKLNRWIHSLPRKVISIGLDKRKDKKS